MAQKRKNNVIKLLKQRTLMYIVQCTVDMYVEYTANSVGVRNNRTDIYPEPTTGNWWIRSGLLRWAALDPDLNKYIYLLADCLSPI